MDNIEKKIDLLAWCKKKGRFSSVEVKKFGDDNFYTSADVRVRELVRQRVLERIPDEEIKRLRLNRGPQKIAWYQYVEHHPQSFQEEKAVKVRGQENRLPQEALAR